MNVETERLKQFLLDAQLISQEDFNRALKLSEETGKYIGEVLVSESLIEQEKLTKFEAYILGRCLPFCFKRVTNKRDYFFNRIFFNEATGNRQ